jgi:hypothetical protein
MFQQIELLKNIISKYELYDRFMFEIVLVPIIRSSEQNYLDQKFEKNQNETCQRLNNFIGEKEIINQDEIKWMTVHRTANIINALIFKDYFFEQTNSYNIYGYDFSAEEEESEDITKSYLSFVRKNSEQKEHDVLKKFYTNIDLKLSSKLKIFSCDMDYMKNVYKSILFLFRKYKKIFFTSTTKDLSVHSTLFFICYNSEMIFTVYKNKLKLCSENHDIINNYAYLYHTTWVTIENLNLL